MSDELHKDEPVNPQTYLHPVGKCKEDPHHGDCTELPSTFGKQLLTRKFLCYMIVVIIFLALIVYLINRVMGNYLFYSNDSGFMGPTTFISGSTIFLVTLAYTSYHLSSSSHHPTAAFWLFLLGAITYLFAIINLAVRTEYYVKHVRTRGNGSLWLMLCTAMLLGLTIISSQIGTGITLISLIPIGWILFTLYNWWFRVSTRFV